ncbi:MAG: zinc ribbon domain-containing protein [Clostridia bacterium]|nr:zinc ribbon domain-containing protein [Clostridia bacterium]
MFCPNCGFDCKDENFCPKCGRNLKNDDPGVKGENKNTDADTPKAKPSPRELAAKSYASIAQSKSFLCAAIALTVSILINLYMLLDNRGALDQLIETNNTSVISKISFIAMFVIVAAMWVLISTARTKDTINLQWLYLVFVAVLGYLVVNAIANIVNIKMLINADDSLVALVVVMIVASVWSVSIQAVAAIIVYKAANGENIFFLSGKGYLQISLLLMGWLGVAAGVVGLFLVKNVFFYMITVIVNSLAHVFLGKMLKEY